MAIPIFVFESVGVVMALQLAENEFVVAVEDRNRVAGSKKELGNATVAVFCVVSARIVILEVDNNYNVDF